MSIIHPVTKDLYCKIVYYGPSLGGKTTNVDYIRQHSGDTPTEPLSLHADYARTADYDFVPLRLGEVRGYNMVVHLFSVPGQIAHDPYRKLLLTGVDGVVFVADSQPDRLEENVQSLKNLETNLSQRGYDLNRIPFVIQYNKRDVPGVLPVSELRLQLNTYNAPDIEAAAVKGHGVFETLNTLARMIVTVMKGGEI